MKRQAVESSNLVSIGYDSENEVLEIEFNHGGIYQYFNVPQNIYDELINADSHGKYFAAYIRNCYDYKKL